MFAKKLICVLLCSAMLVSPFMLSTAAADELTLDAKSAILVEAASGKVLYEKNADEALPPASVTKIMTLLLVMEAIDSGKIAYDDMVSTSNNAASMGGSQIYLEPGEQMSVDDMIKSVVVSSANDAAVALAEFVCGSEEIFVAKMNERAKELGMTSTCFENTNGLDDTTTHHLTSARDIAVMSRELIRHEKILEYSSIWQDSVRNGSFTLTNTNRLIRFYNGANGLKTGSTSKAGFCISATALRDDMQLIAVIMGSPNRDTRNECAKKLLDYGFASFTCAKWEGEELTPIAVRGGTSESCALACEGFTTVVKKGDRERIVRSIELPEYISAPIKSGDEIGNVLYTLDGELIGKTSITAVQDIERIGYAHLLARIFRRIILVG